MRRTLLPLLLALISAAAVAAEPLVFHYPDSGAPPWLYLTPGGSKPTGIVADVIEAAARQAGRELHYEFRPREDSNDALLGGGTDGAMFFGVTRPPAKGVLVTEPLLRMDTVLVTLKNRPVNYARPLDLQNRRLCTLTDEVYPPLTLLAMNGTLLQRKAKTEQAQLLMLRNEDCVAATINGPMYRWLSSRYHWNDLRTEKQPLVNDSLLLGFGTDERGMVEAVDGIMRKLRASGELAHWLSRHVADTTNLSMR